MPIPPQYRLTDVSVTLVHDMCRLCTEIERSIGSGSDAAELLAKWHQHTTRIFQPSDFTSYWKAIDQEEFVRESLNPRPKYAEDLSYHDVYAIVASISAGELPDNQLSYYLEWLEIQFPNIDVSNLIYWPDEWFDDASLVRNEDGSFKPEAELSVDQILAYAIAKSGRVLRDSPKNIVLPFPLPTK